MKFITAILTIGSIFIISTQGQGFLNLNFESAQNLPGNPGSGGVLTFVTNALPDWTAFDDDAALNAIYYVSNSSTGGGSAVELEAGSLALNGNNYSAGLNVGGSISQTGLVPGNAESLQFEAYIPGGLNGPSGFQVTLGGQNLSFSALYDGPDYIEYGANVPADMDGQMEGLTFGIHGAGSGDVLLDDIQFSSSPTPEPREMALIGLGAGIFYMRKRPPSPKATGGQGGNGEGGFWTG